jgi:hypothetical protein
MTGRELIIYILENHLEDEQIVKDGCLIGFMDTVDAAKKFNVGTVTVDIWVRQGRLPAVEIGHTIYIPANCSLKELN